MAVLRTSKPNLMIIVLVAGMTSQSVLLSAAIPILPQLAASSGRSGPLVAQLAMALPSLGLIVAGPFVASIERNLGLKGAIVSALAAYMILGSWPLFWKDLGPLLATRFFLGMSCSLLTAATGELLALTYGGEQRRRVAGYQVAVASGVGLLTILVSGQIAARVDWHWSFLIYAVTAVTFLAPALAIRSTPRVEVAALVPVSPDRSVSAYWPLFVAACCLFALPSILGGYIPFLLAERGVTNPAIEAGVIAMSTLGSMVSGSLFGRVQHWLGLRATLACSLLIGGIGLGFIGLTGTAVLSGFGALLCGVGTGLYMPYLYVQAMNVEPEHVRARVLGLLPSSMFLGGFLYPAFMAPAVAAIGIANTMCLIALVLLPTAAYVFLSRRNRSGPPSTEAMPAPQALVTVLPQSRTDKLT